MTKTTPYEAQCGLLMQKQIELNVDYDPLGTDIAQAYDTLMEYFTKDEHFLKRDSSYSFHKGLLLMGNIGCGKTLMMKMFSTNLVNNYQVINCRKIASEFAIHGDEGIQKYFEVTTSNLSGLGYGRACMRSICFDDLGTEPDKKYFGQEVNVILEVMLRRYDNGDFTRTHATTNLTPGEIKSRYGERLTSRFREMFNLIKFPANSPDRRK